MQKLYFIDGKRKYLFCTDLLGYSEVSPIMEEVVRRNLPFEFVFLGYSVNQEAPATDLSQWLSKQKMGTYLYVAGAWDKLREIKQLAEEIGFSEEEAQYVGVGPRMIRVFCCRCHGINDCSVQTAEIQCRHCELALVVTDHYSPLRDAYQGFVAKL